MKKSAETVKEEQSNSKRFEIWAPLFIKEKAKASESVETRIGGSEELF